MSQSSEEEVPESDIDEPRITEETAVDDDPVCDWCGEPAEYDTHSLLGDDRVVAVLKVPSLSDNLNTGAGPLCQSCYDQTETSAYWKQYDYEESVAQERRAGIDT